MGVEGKDRAKVLEAGAASLSNQLGIAVQRLRKSFGLSLADLSAQSGVAKSIISQIERNETNPTLTTIWRLAHALDVSIELLLQGGEGGPFIEHLKRGTTPIFVSDDGLCRLAVTGWLKTVDWLQWYDFQADPGGVLEFERARARLGRVPVGPRGRARGRRRRIDRDGRRRRDPALSLRPAAPHPQSQRQARSRDDGQYSQGGDDRLRPPSDRVLPAAGRGFLGRRRPYKAGCGPRPPFEDPMKSSFFSALALALAFAGVVPACGQEARDVAAGRKLALDVCASCHVVAPDQARAPVLDPPAPSFAAIAAKPDATEASLRRFLAEPHGDPRRSSKMSAFLLPPSQVDAAVAYLLSLKPK